MIRFCPPPPRGGGGGGADELMYRSACMYKCLCGVSLSRYVFWTRVIYKHMNQFIYIYNYHAFYIYTIPGGPKNGTVDSLGLCSDQQLSFFTLLDRASFPHYNNTKIIKFGWELFILWVLSYGLSFSGFAINLSLIVPRKSGNRANPENDSP